ncbi:hypothetical protein BaRGS_00007886 [Batillaria attramentaria]|uniref:Tubulin polymerization-promoting protein family member 3 n=1 Tax=Batillaria attramentaria TaxID=370345 RepID=A0ABD0LP36_9CAEN|nr:hypothetical protein BaRGS_023147 [Batillaria attramentaria]
MASGGDVDQLCREFFEMCVEKTSVGKKLTPADKKLAKSSAVKKMLQEGIGAKSDTVSFVDASVFSKYQDKKTKQVSEDDFMEKMFPEIAAFEAKKKKGADAAEELTKLKEKMAKKCEAEKAGGGGSKNAAVVDRLTDTSKYTGAHKERFDASGRGKGIDGREVRVENKGYVGNYKGEGSYDAKKK